MRRFAGDSGRLGATQSEVMVVAAMLAALALLILPGLTETSERARKARCLNNLRNLAAAAHGYASEDSRELLLPIHQMTVSTLHREGWTGTFTPMNPADTYPAWVGAVRVGMGYSFGGRTATVPFGPTTVLTDPNGYWGARTRPLNHYVLASGYDSDIEDSQSFACPADIGYPISPFVADVPRELANIPCYGLAGNSYRYPFGGYFWLMSGGGSSGQFSVSVFGHSRSSLQQTDRLMLFVEPMLYTTSRILGFSPEQNPPPTWHGETFSDQMALADGSARPVFAKQYIDWRQSTLIEMNVANDNPWFYYLRKSTLWSTDAYPTPGARIVMRRPDGTIVTPNVPQNQLTKYPYLNHTVID